MQKYLSIGNRIAYIRSRSHLIQTKFAQSIGISPSFLSELENGITKPSMPILFTIEYKYNYRHEWVLTGDGETYLDPLQVRESITGYETSSRVLTVWINRLIRIFEEGDEKKIEAIKASLRALDPLAKKQKLPKKEDVSIDKKAM